MKKKFRCLSKKRMISQTKQHLKDLCCQLTAEVKDKYEENNDYDAEKKYLDRDQKMTVDIGFDPVELGYKNFTDVVGIFQDAKLTQEIVPTFKMNEEKTEIEIAPPKNKHGAIGTLDIDESDCRI